MPESYKRVKRKMSELYNSPTETTPRERLKKLLGKRGIFSDLGAAKALGLPRSTWQYAAKSGHFRRDSIARIAYCTGLNPQWIKEGQGLVWRDLEAADATGWGDLAREMMAEQNQIDPRFRHEDGFAAAAKTGRDSVRIRLQGLFETSGFDDQARFAESIGLAPDELEQILADDLITNDQARKIANASTLSYEYIRHGRGPDTLKSTEIKGYKGVEGEAAERGVTYEPRAIPPDLTGYFRLVPKVSASLSAGGGIIPDELVETEWFAFRLDWLKRVITAPRNGILFDIEGDSMAPDYKSGDTVLIDRGRTRVIDGGVYAIGVAGVLQLKRLYCLPTGKIRVESIVPDHYGYTAEPSDILIIGRPVWKASVLI
jgi:phage repressor protein C with HTH and peptisase S24 domain